MIRRRVGGFARGAVVGILSVVTALGIRGHRAPKPVMTPAESRRIDSMLREEIKAGKVPTDPVRMKNWQIDMENRAKIIEKSDPKRAEVLRKGADRLRRIRRLQEE